MNNNKTVSDLKLHVMTNMAKNIFTVRVIYLFNKLYLRLEFL